MTFAYTVSLYGFSVDYLARTSAAARRRDSLPGLAGGSTAAWRILRESLDEAVQYEYWNISRRNLLTPGKLGNGQRSSTCTTPSGRRDYVNLLQYHIV